jgi:MoxR-like ATPase
MSGRDYVLPDDLRGPGAQRADPPLLPSVEASMSGRTTGAILDGIIAAVPVPEGPVREHGA